MQISTVKLHKTKDRYTINQGYEYIGEDYWDWWVWVESSDANLDKIDHVVYNLHYTFREPVQVVRTRENKFMLKTSGWGTFVIYVRLNFKDGSVLDLSHELELLYPSGKKNEA